MENLKITFNLSTPVILNRYLTIDNILLNSFFNLLRKEKKIDGFIKTEDYIDKIDWLDKQKGILSGSIWYIENDDNLVLPYNVIITKKPEEKRIYELTGKKIDTGRGEFKAFKFGMEALIIDNIYFYVKGNKDIINNLLENVRFIGKKGNMGFGKIKNFIIEEIGKDKSFMIDETTPSKPLPCDRFDVNTKKVALYRTIPPYYEKEGIVPCYMPTRSLIEKKDETYKNNNFMALKNFKFISPASFAKNILKNKFELEDIKGSKKYKKVDNNTQDRCVMCGTIHKKGLKGNMKDIFPKTFNDYPFLSKGDFICIDCLWSIKQENERILGNTFISPNKFFYLQGKNMSQKKPQEQQKFRDNFFRNLDTLKPPFLISLKSSKNAQHTLFKGKVAISNAIIPVSFGNEEETLIDVELLNEAIKDMKKITNNNKCIKKTHLTNYEQIDNSFPKLSKKCNNMENLKILSNFYKKYDRSIRKILNRIIV